ALSTLPNRRVFDVRSLSFPSQMVTLDGLSSPYGVSGLGSPTNSLTLALESLSSASPTTSASAGYGPGPAIFHLPSSWDSSGILEPSTSRSTAVTLFRSKASTDLSLKPATGRAVSRNTDSPSAITAGLPPSRA